MATIVTQTLSLATMAKPSLAAASVSDDYDCGPGCFAVIAVGGTATTITVVDPRVTEYGQAFPDPTSGSVTSAEKWIPLPGYLANANGKATVQCSQVTAVTSAGVSFR